MLLKKAIQTTDQLLLRHKITCNIQGKQPTHGIHGIAQNRSTSHFTHASKNSTNVKLASTEYLQGYPWKTTKQILCNYEFARSLTRTIFFVFRCIVKPQIVQSSNLERIPARSLLKIA